MTGLKHIRIFQFCFFFSGFAIIAQINLKDQTIKLQNVDSVFFELKTNLEENRKGGNQDLLAKSHLEMGKFYSGYGVFSEAVSHFNEALHLIEDRPVDTLNIWLNNAIGEVDFARRNLEMAQQHFEEASKLSKTIGYKKGIAISNGLLGACYEKLGKYDEALEKERQALKLFEELDDTLGISKVNENIGSIYEDLEKYMLAKNYFSMANEAVEGLGTSAEANILNNLGDVYRKLGNYQLALKYTVKALQVGKKSNDLHQLESASKDLSKTYALMGEYENAHEYLIAADDYKNQWLDMQNTDQLNVLLAIYENKKKENQIALLEEQNKVSRANQNVLWIALFVLMLIGGFFFFYRHRKRTAELKLKALEQRALKAELEKKEEEEKNLQREIQLKVSALSRYSLHLSQKNKILHDLSLTLKNIASRKHMNVEGKLEDIVKDINFNLRHEGEWDEFMTFFKEIHPDFTKKLSTLSETNLSPSEMRLGMLLRLNMSSKEIASVLRVTPDSVRVARYRLRKKLPIGHKDELVNFLVEL